MCLVWNLIRAGPWRWHMTRFRFLTLIIAVTLWQGASASTSSRSISITTDGGQGIERCDQIRVRFDSDGEPLEIARSEERIVATANEISRLRINFSGAGG